jgi:AcrR family transcriptional regulator
MQDLTPPVVPLDSVLLEGARRALVRYGWEDATLERIAREAGVSRMTLHRRGVSRARLLEALAERLEEDYRAALWPPLTAAGSGRERLELALRAECAVVERNLDLLDALGARTRAQLFHEPGPEALTRAVFTEPLRRLLTDGAGDGTLRRCDAVESATVLFNLVSHTYRHLRTGHGWNAERARGAVVDVALRGVAAP